MQFCNAGKTRMKGGPRIVALGALLSAALTFPTTARANFFKGFETDTSGWFTVGTESVNREPSGYVSPVPYASGVASATGGFHARLRRGACVIDPTGGGGPSVECDGPFTRWGGYNATWTGGYTTQVDVYLDDPYAIANPDSYPGNIGCLTANSNDNSCKGTRFDFSSAINDSSGNFLRDFVFNIGTGDPGQPTPCLTGGWVVAASTNAFRSGASPYDLGHDPFCVATSGWYTLRHTFKDVGGLLVVVMDILPAGSGTPIHTWTITPGDAISGVGCNRYGWFAEQEVQDLATDNSKMIGCGAPLPQCVGDPDGTPCNDGNACTVGDVCKNGSCSAGGAFLNCDDHNACTDDSCNPASGCVHTNKNCDDHNACTDDSCNPASGCVHTNNTAPCDDGNACTINDTCQNGTCQGTESCHFECYETKPKLTPIAGVTLVDQFGPATINVRQVDRICNPADKNHEDPGAQLAPDHLVGYRNVSPRFAAVRNITVVNQFGTLVVDAVRPDRLLVPSAKSLASPPPPPSSAAGALIDHFRCYRVKARGFTPISGVTVLDEFTTRTVTVKKPSVLCNPANKRGENPGAENDPLHLMCYRVVASSRFSKVKGIFVNNQFGPETLDAIRLEELCVPSLKNPTGTTTTTTTTPTTSSSTSSTATSTSTTLLACGSSPFPACGGACPTGTCTRSSPAGAFCFCSPSGAFLGE